MCGWRRQKPGNPGRAKLAELEIEWVADAIGTTQVVS